MMRSFHLVLERLCNEVLIQLEDEDWIQVVIKSDTHNHHISTNLKKRKHFSVEDVLILVQDSVQSSFDMKVHDGIRVDIVSVRTSNARDTEILAGARYRKFFPPSDLAKNLKCMVAISNTDNMCMARSIAVCMSVMSDDYLAVRHSDTGRHHSQRSKALGYCELADVNPEVKCGREEVKRFEKVLNVRIKIVAGDLLDKFIYPGQMENLELPSIYLYRSRNNDDEYHYDAITCISAFFEKKYFCHACNVAYKYLTQHRCEDRLHNWCYSCNHRDCAGCDKSVIFKKCEKCRKLLRSRQCMENHINFAENNCLTYTCVFCLQSLKRNCLSNGQYETNEQIIKRHKKCSISCSVCGTADIQPTHKCYMQYTPFKPFVKKVVYLDFETNQESGIHKAVYCYIRWIFKTNSNEIQEQGQQEFGVEADVGQKVGEFLFSDKFKHSSIVAHNMKGFDGCFLIQYLTENRLKPDRVIANGTKLVSFHVPKFDIRIVDSLSFLPMPLSQIPKAFGLDESKYFKGYFPHFFTKEENFHTVSSGLPSRKDFGYEEFTSEQRDNFDVWYEERRGSEFDFDVEMRKYCKQDVEILCEGFEAFRKTVMTLSEELLNDQLTDDSSINSIRNVLPAKYTDQIVVEEEEESVQMNSHPLKDQQDSCDPLAYITLAGLCHAIFKACFLKPNTIALVPSSGYSNHKYSKRAVEWLEYLRQTTAPGIKHVGNSNNGEYKIGKYRVDGFDPQTKTIYEFYGCFFHGHAKCVENMFELNPVTHITFQGLYEQTILREKQLSALGYNIVHIWECEWESMKVENKDCEILQSCLKEIKGFLPINPRNAFKGGRTETMQLRGKSINHAKIRYLDVNSLYPFVLDKKMFPLGHPVILSHIIDTDISSFFGFVKCDISPPKQLYHPVLPFTVNDKLLFPLCAQCASTGDIENCEHDAKDRTLQGTWFSEELKLAEKMGYVIEKVYQVMHFEECTDQLFHQYIQTFYKMKILASGVPDNVEMFVKDVAEREGIILDVSQFMDNPSRRWLAKLLLNAFWGRFGMREDRTGCEFISAISELTAILNDQSKVVSMIKPIGRNMAVVSYKVKHSDLIPLMNNTNLYIAAVTTSYARMELYKYLDACSYANKSLSYALYCDTDSIIYVDGTGVSLPEGGHLGDLSDELKGGDYILSFVSGGPKNYAYITKNGKECVKVKGFSLHSLNKKAFSLQNINDMVSYFITRFSRSNDNRILSQSMKDHRKEAKLIREYFIDKHADDDECVLFDREKGISVIYKNKIRRTGDFQLISVTEERLNKFYFDKRVIQSNYDTVPFGY
jgi:hypothetical protein